MDHRVDHHPHLTAQHNLDASSRSRSPAETLVRNTKLAFAERAQGFTEVDRTQGRETAMVVVGTLPLACSHLLPSAINALAETNPEVRVSVLDAPYDDLLRGLRIGDLDVRRCVEGSVAGRRRRPEAAVRRPVRRRRET